VIKTWSTPVSEEKKQSIPCILCGGTHFREYLKCEGFSYKKCNGCGLILMNPQPLASEVRKRYTSLYGDDYRDYELENEDNYLELQKLALRDAGFYTIEKQLMINGKPAILDVGCATGALLAWLRERGWETTGLEISPAADYAKQTRKLDVSRKSLEEADFPAASFNVILASHLVEHLNNPDEFIANAGKILRPGGFLLVSTPNAGSFQAKIFKNNWRSAIFDHLFLYSKKTIRKHLQKHGFKIRGIYTWGGLAEGTAPKPLKRLADKSAKIFGFGDVMIIKAVK